MIYYNIYQKIEVVLIDAKRAIELHHVLGVKNNATGNFQLLRSDLNKLADTIEATN